MLIDTLIKVKNEQVDLASKVILNEIKNSLLFRAKSGHTDLNWAFDESSYIVQEAVINVLKEEGLKVKLTQYDSNVINISGW